MTFEEALRAELVTVENLSNKVFPLYAPKETAAPFAVYKKSNIKFHRTFGGAINKTEGLYNITILANSYAELQQISTGIINKLTDIENATIGNDTLYIDTIDVEHLGDQYEFEADLFRSDIQLRVNY